MRCRRQMGALIWYNVNLDKTSKAKCNEQALLCRSWSGKHHRVVQGINLITLLWIDSECHSRCDYRYYAT